MDCYLFSTINHQRYGVLIYSPLCRYGNVLCRHGCGYRHIPAIEGIACLGRVCGCGYRRAVVLRYGCNFSDAVRIEERYGVLIYFPLRRYGNVLCGHGCGYRPIPLYKGIACLGRVCGCGYIRAVVLRFGCNFSAAIRIERYGVLIYFPLRRYGHVLRGHGCGDVLIPTGKGVTCLGRGCGCGYILVIALRYRLNMCAAVRIERYGIHPYGFGELCRVGCVAGNLGYLRLPTAELIAVMLIRSLSRLGMSRLCAVCYFGSFLYAVNFPRYCICPFGFGELCRIGCVARDGGNCGSPALKRVGVLLCGRLGRDCTCVSRRFAVRHLAGLKHRVAVLPRYGILVYFFGELRRVGYIFGNYRVFVNLGFPTAERVGVLRIAFLGRSFAVISWLCAVLHLLGFKHRVAVLPRYGVLIDRLLKYRCVLLIARDGSDFRIPALKRVGVLLCGRLGRGFAVISWLCAVFHLLGFKHLAVPILPRYGVHVYCSGELCRVGCIARNFAHLGIPSAKRVSVLCGFSLGRGCACIVRRCAIVHLLGFKHLVVPILPRYGVLVYD